MMKTKFLLLSSSFILFAYLAFSQLSVDIGNDITFCSGLGQADSLFLGSTLTIKNGIPPYSYQWESKLEISENLIFTAGDFLNDTTIADPYLTGGETLGIPLRFSVQVTDAENNTASDSITIDFSICGCPTGYSVIQLNKGDSVLLDAGTPAGKYIDYFWEPSIGLATPDSSTTWCKPDTTINYNLVRVDSFGCVCSCHAYEIRVSDTILNVDAGENLIVCSGDWNEEFIIGGNPTALGGVPPYTFTWSGKHYDQKYPEGTPMWIYASDILDDTTKSNPTISEWRNVNEEWTTYYLKVEDATGNVGYDSVKIIGSEFWIHMIYILPDTLIRGDSIQLIGDPYFVNDFLPFSYVISPSHGLTDSTNINGWAKPDTSTTYFIQATNSVGCVSNWIEYWHIEVIDTTTSIRSFAESEIQCFLSNGNLIINQNNFTAYNLMVTTLHGQTVHSGNYHEKNLMLSNLGLKPKGLYLVTIITGMNRQTFKLINN